MRISVKTRNLCVRCLAESFDVRTMNHVARLIDRNYDIHERSGFPETMVIPGRDAAKQIVLDLLAWNRFIELIQQLARIQRDGISGRMYRVPGLRALIRSVEEMGFHFDAETCTFHEDAARNRTPNWGVLEEGRNYVVSLLRIDIVGNSRLVKDYPNDIIQQTYAELREIFQTAVDGRNGRVWNWEGDGATAAFYGENTQLTATLAAVNIVHELFFYNALRCRLPMDLQVRAAVHNGQIEYHEKFERMKGPAFSTLVEIESKHGKPQSVYLSETVYTALTAEVADWLTPLRLKSGVNLYRYELKFGE